MTCPSLATSLINHGLRNDEPSAVKDTEKSRMVVSASAWAGTHTYRTAGCIPLSHRWTCSYGL